ncbi:gdsl esteraselipase [Nicotiana attenuata]|uniref:Gdsl esteraselipase n=1 Tax=Nicotiana attenuata TaxID=49451 RepID=A0A314KPG6_NICAT|nr:gdsl esteraselipase [Nicotiana attenuata]
MKPLVRMSLWSYSKVITWVFLAAILFMVDTTQCKNCGFKAIFNFGDSNTDTGGYWAAFPAQGPPHGMTFFKKPVGRATDGGVILDFLAQALGLPFLSPYLQSIQACPFSLQIQLRQMKEFKVKVDELQHKGQTNLPSPDVFGKSLYTFYIGQNDFTGNLARIGIIGVKEFLPQLISQIVSTIKEIYALGGRTFWVLNLAPIGCYPAFLVELPHNTSDIHQFGCLISYNNAVVDYNNMLKAALAKTREEICDANVVYVDSHAVLLDLFQHPTSHGLKYGTKACCGYGGGAYNFNQQVFCGNTKQINGTTVTAKACEDPEYYVSWDGIHTTDAANELTVYAILNGSYFDPPFPLHHLCDI